MDRGHVERWTIEPRVISGDLILRLQKYRDPSKVVPQIREAADAVAEEATRLLAPDALVWRGPATVVNDDGAVVLAGAHRVHSQALARMLGASRDAYVVVLTAGAGIEERARTMFDEGLLLESFLMDTAGWAAIELLVRDLRRRLIKAERAGGRSVTHRLGPGHLDWAVAEQPTLLGVFGDAPLPVRLTEAALMLPQKSISGVYGVVARR